MPINNEQSAENPQVSIIVPVYNSEKYLDRCIQSFVNQTGPTLEIVLVDDGSTDSSASICESWVKKDSRIHAIYQKNEGPSNARKAGVECSTGEWIFFVDSDDTVTENAMSTLFKHIRDDVDMVIGTMISTKLKNYYRYNYEEKNTLQYMKLLLKTKVQGGPVAKLIRKSLFDSFTFDIPPEVSSISEDFIMNIRIGQKVRNVIFLPDIVYNYIWRPNSTISKFQAFYSQKKYRAIYDNLVKQSIKPNYLKPLRGVLIWHYFYRRYRLARSIIHSLLR
jgi:glycosyltransferase involved in cell wall biosynthesis